MTGKPTYEELERRIKELEEAVDRTAVESLQTCLERYRAAFETAKDAIFITDETGRFFDVNRAAFESLGYSKDELLQLSNRDIDYDESGYETFLKVHDGLAEQATFEVNLRKEDGTLLVIPFLEKMKKSQLDRKQISYIDILELNLNDIISPFLQNFSVKYASLTPTEIQVAHLVRHGVRSKEIANLLDLSKRTVDSHRANIREKLKIKNKKSNLRSYLSANR